MAVTVADYSIGGNDWENYRAVKFTDGGSINAKSNITWTTTDNTAMSNTYNAGELMQA